MRHILTPVHVLLGALAIGGCWLALRWTLAVRAAARDERRVPTGLELAVGFVTNFFDTLGIGSFATTTTVFRLFRMVPDELIPGTMLVGHGLPVIAQALIFISVIDVDPWQLSLLIGACIAGGYLGAGVVSSLSRRAVRLGMGSALIAAACFMLLGLLGWFPAGGQALVFTPRALALALVINFALGALVTVGIGNYAPSLIAFSLMGIDPRGAFPIMAGSGAFVACVAGIRFISTARFHPRAALGLTLGGIPGVLVAAWLVQSLPLDALRWAVLAVVGYTAIMMLRSGLTDS